MEFFHEFLRDTIYSKNYRLQDDKRALATVHVQAWPDHPKSAAYCDYPPEKLRKLRNNILSIYKDRLLRNGLAPGVHEHETPLFKVHFDFDHVTVPIVDPCPFFNVAIKNFISWFYTNCCDSTFNKKRTVYVVTSFDVGNQGIQDQCGIHLYFEETVVSTVMEAVGEFAKDYFDNHLKGIFGEQSSLDTGIYGGLKSMRLPFCRKGGNPFDNDDRPYVPFNIYEYNPKDDTCKIVRTEQERKKIGEIIEVADIDERATLMEQFERAEVDDAMLQRYSDNCTMQVFLNPKPNLYKIFLIRSELGVYMRAKVDKTKLKILEREVEGKYLKVI